MVKPPDEETTILDKTLDTNPTQIEKLIQVCCMNSRKELVKDTFRDTYPIIRVILIKNSLFNYSAYYILYWQCHIIMLMH